MFYALTDPITLTFDLKIGSWVTRVMGFHPANFGLHALFRSRGSVENGKAPRKPKIGRVRVRSKHATYRQTDRRTDRQTPAIILMLPTYYGRGIMKIAVMMLLLLLLLLMMMMMMT